MKFEIDVKFSRLTKEFLATAKVGNKLLKTGVAKNAAAAITNAMELNKDALVLQGCDEILKTPGRKSGDGEMSRSPGTTKSDALSDLISDSLSAKPGEPRTAYISNLARLERECIVPPERGKHLK